MSFLNKVTHAVIHPIRKSMSGLDRTIDNNAWLRTLSTALGGEKYRTGLRMLDDKPLNKWDSNDWKQMADSVSAYRAYKGGQRSQTHAGAAAELGAEHEGLGGQDLLLQQIRSAYGIEDDGGVHDRLQRWIADTDARLAMPSYRVFGPERQQLQQNRARLVAMLQEAGPRNGTGAATAGQAIDSMSARSAAASKRDATRELDSRLAATLTRNNALAFTRGTSGSSFDKEAQAGALGDYERGRTGIANTLAASDRAFRANLDSQRLGLEDRARSGAAKSFDPSAALTEQGNAAGQAYDNLTGRAIGETLATGSDLAINDILQRQSGGRGFAGVVPRRTQSGGVAGTISRG